MNKDVLQQLVLLIMYIYFCTLRECCCVLRYNVNDNSQSTNMIRQDHHFVLIIYIPFRRRLINLTSYVTDLVNLITLALSLMARWYLSQTNW